MSDPQKEPKEKAATHYYGDYVRRLFLGAGVATLLILPFYNTLLPAMSPDALVLFVIVIILFAAILNPRRSATIAGIDALISIIGVYLFAYYAVTEYANTELIVTVLRQALAVVFAFALYFSVKTLRARIVRTGEGPRHGRDEEPRRSVRDVDFRRGGRE